eukprot:8809331-Heterocapsa_arctica.AAC.1
MVCGIRLYLRYIDTARNHADGPWRGFPIGHAPAWAADCRDPARRLAWASRSALVAAEAAPLASTANDAEAA